MKKVIVIMGGLLLNAAVVMAANYIEAPELKGAYEKKSPVIVVDIQPVSDFAKQHLPGAIETNAFPAKSAEEKQRLDKTLATIKASESPVVIVCPRGKSGAKNSYEYLLSQGVDEKRLLILQDGIAGWPYKEMLQQGR